MKGIFLEFKKWNLQYKVLKMKETIDEEEQKNYGCFVTTVASYKKSVSVEHS